MAFYVYDTETTGLPPKGKNIPLELRPHVLQFAGKLFDEDRNTIMQFSTLVVLPSGVEPQPEAFNVHGISAEKTLAFGLLPKTVLAMHRHMIDRSHTQIAHNHFFDQQRMNELAWRLSAPKIELGGKTCTADGLTEYMNIPPTERMKQFGFNGPKKPNLMECYTHFFNEEFSGAHDAMVDVDACALVFFEARDRGIM